MVQDHLSISPSLNQPNLQSLLCHRKCAVVTGSELPSGPSLPSPLKKNRIFDSPSPSLCINNLTESFNSPVEYMVDFFSSGRCRAHGRDSARCQRAGMKPRSLNPSQRLLACLPALSSFFSLFSCTSSFLFKPVP